MNMNFDVYIGVDYAGARSSTCRMKELQVYAAFGNEEPRRVLTPSSTEKTYKNWTRQEIALWLMEQAKKDITYIVGLPHGFSFPADHFARHDLDTWDEFLEDHDEQWPIGGHGYIESFLDREEGPPDRIGGKNELRITEKWTSYAKSVFNFYGQGQNAKATHAGIPLLRAMRREVGEHLHFWPFDGWEVPDGKSVVAEVYPFNYRNRYPQYERNVDQHDAYVIARWLSESDARGILGNYFNPHLTVKERYFAEIEGWILGVT